MDKSNQPFGMQQSQDSAISLSEEELKNLEELIKETTNENDQLKKSLNDEMQKTGNLEQTNKLLIEQLKNTESAYEELVNENAIKDDLIKRLQEELNKLKKQNKSLADANKDLSKELLNFQEEKAKLKVENQKLNAENRQLVINNDTLQSKIDNSQFVLDAEKDKNNKLQCIVEELKEENLELERKIEFFNVQSCQEKEVFEKRIMQLEQTNNELCKKVKDLKDDVEGVEKNNQNEIIALEIQNMDLQKENDKLQKENEELNKAYKIQELQNSITKLIDAVNDIGDLRNIGYQDQSYDAFVIDLCFSDKTVEEDSIIKTYQEIMLLCSELLKLNNNIGKQFTQDGVNEKVSKTLKIFNLESLMSECKNANNAI